MQWRSRRYCSHVYALSELPEALVDAALDRELRALLCACFTEPEDHVFRERRYFREPPAHRWLLRDTEGELVAHTALHFKELTTGDHRVAIGGVAEVCVRAEHRRRGLAKRMLDAVDRLLIERGTPLAVLFGDPRIYRSSGYRTVDNLFYRDPDRTRWLSGDGMVKELAPGCWPRAPAYLDGPTF